jgi:aldehyde dehydrogenase (NAD+)
MTSNLLAELGIKAENSGVGSKDWATANGEWIESINPATAKAIAQVRMATADDYRQVVDRAHAAFLAWRLVPAPVRGDVIRQLGDALRRKKTALGELASLEAGKIRSEGLGEVQEMIDVCDFAVGLSRQLYGLTIASERPNHRMMEQWHPLGVVGVITAFNFPVAVWAWNAAIAAVCGDTIVWKPSERTPLTAIAVHNICREVVASAGLPDVFHLCIGTGADVGESMAKDDRVPLVSATGSCAMGRKVAANVASRLGRTLLELGGNNAVIVTTTADLDLALRGCVFAAAGTAGQRCTTLRRLIIHDLLIDSFTERMAKAYSTLKIGDPLEENVLVGPLISKQAVEQFEAAIKRAVSEGGEVVCGGKRIDRTGFFVEPTIIKAKKPLPIMQEETFAPILYVVPFKTMDEAIAIQNGVRQGLSSSAFTNDVREMEKFLGPAGSDCGIANINIGTSGAEIGGAFGGEKETGGGRESGSDSWKAYMRRQTCTINGGGDLPLAQGVRFDVI